MRSEPITRCHGGAWEARDQGLMIDPWSAAPEEDSLDQGPDVGVPWWSRWGVEGAMEEVRLLLRSQFHHKVKDFPFSLALFRAFTSRLQWCEQLLHFIVDGFPLCGCLVAPGYASFDGYNGFNNYSFGNGMFDERLRGERGGRGKVQNSFRVMVMVWNNLHGVYWTI